MALPALAGAVQFDLAASADFTGAQRALESALPNVARVKLERLLARKDLSSKDRDTVLQLEVEACLRAGDLSAATALLDANQVQDEAFWRGQALLLAGDFKAAESAFSSCPKSSPMRKRSLLGLAHALAGQGRDAAARRAIKDLRDDKDAEIARNARLIFNELELGEDRAQVVLDRLARETGGKDPRVQYLRARALYQLQDFARAEAVLRDILSTPGTGRHGHDAAEILLTQVLAEKDPAAALQQLITFLNSFSSIPTVASTESDYWLEAFTTLDSLSQKPALATRTLAAAVSWIADPTIPQRHAHALYLAAQLLYRSGRIDEALGMLESLLQLHPGHPRRADALRMAMKLHGARKADNRVLSLATTWRNETGVEEVVVDFLTALIRFARGEYGEAATLFATAATSDDNADRRRLSLYNAAVSALKAGQQALFLTLFAQLEQTGRPDAPDRASAVDLKLDRALALAAQVDISAAENELNAFVEDKTNAEHPRLAEAWLALAELRLLDVPPRVETAETALQTAIASHPTDPIKERIDYVRIWLQEARQNPAAVTTEAENFLARWPQSPRAPDVHMKLGEAYYRNQNYARARTNFELVAKDWPQSPLADSALYFAGKAAMAVATPEGINTAISLWEELADSDSPLAFDARVQQVFAKRRQGANEEALKLLDTLIGEAPPDRKVSLLADKSELLLSLAKEKPSNYALASTLLEPDRLPPGLAYHQRARLAVLRALALKAQQRTDEALEACYDAVEAGLSPDTPVATPSEFEWFYRAGFLAIEYLEEQKQWEPAAILADRLGRTAGPLAREAAEKASRIRLQHYLWDGKK